ncbi:hypothetical protein [Fimbriiglobus ruber]|uniref:Uncharacterized protein n=1 Tax=Fimbriiglobus ruber TaxID=1908690 RepID=A0A225DHM8_9BACT|nr:hypothetical protein [Fimbriiglobus ruber]OWK41000.1 hypothetical protein FRUB_04892 [Fimbriiglobus ruber]
MGIVRDIFEGITTGLVTATRDPPRPSLGPGPGTRDPGRIDRFCRALGWSIDGRDGDAVELHFRNPTGGIAIVRVESADEDWVLFSAHSAAVLPVSTVPPEVTGYLLRQNAALAAGGWAAIVSPSSAVAFGLLYRTPGPGLCPASFQLVCESMAREAAEFDARLAAAGLLRRP